MKFIIAGIILGVLFAGCRNNSKPEVKELMQQVEIGRLDKDVFALDTLNPDLKKLGDKYGRYLDIYTQGVLNLGTLRDTGFVRLFELLSRTP